MPTNDLINESAGFQLRELLIAAYPLDADSSNTVLKSIDRALAAEGELYETIYRSTINHLTRRLITLALFLSQEFGDDETLFLRKLRQGIENNFRFPATTTERMVTLLYECVRISGRRYSSGRPTRIFNAVSRRTEPRCYVCGRTVSNPVGALVDDSATLDHVWPNALGGNNGDGNLRIACQLCNQTRGDTIDGSDFHYERICVSVSKNHAHFDSEMNNERKIALLAKNDFKCCICGAPAHAVGELEFFRKNDGDTWNYFNILTRCVRHRR
jgi:5-methylcytosine-specific restriction endonuclease McrA